MKKVKILAIDDSELELNLLKAILAKQGYDPIGLSSGSLILDTIVSEKPDLVLLDIVMPGQSGLEVLQVIRKAHSALELPVIMLTSKNSASDVVECLFAGANDFISKPADVDVLKMRIETQLTIKNLSQQMASLKEVEAINAMIVTYNHEINNPLAIAVASIKNISGELKDNVTLKRLERAVWRIADIVKKINGAVKKDHVVYEDYVDQKMVKIK